MLHSLKATGAWEMAKAGATREEVAAFASWLGNHTGDAAYQQRANEFLTILKLAGFAGEAGKSHVLGRSRFPAKWFQEESWLQVNAHSGLVLVHGLLSH